MYATLFYTGFGWNFKKGFKDFEVSGRTDRKKISDSLNESQKECMQ